MRVLVQRVISAAVEVEHQTVGSIGQGFLLLIGFTHADDERCLPWMAKKIAGLRIYEDEAGKMNRSILDLGGQILAVSQFTLYADTKKGKRPSFVAAAPPKQAEALYQAFCESLRKEGLEVQTGLFGAHMKVSLINDGPVTIIVDKEN